MNTTITFDMDKRCAECGKKGAGANGLCIRCIGNAICDKPMKSVVGQAVQRRVKKGKD